MNNSRIFSDTVKMTEWVKFNKKGEKTVTPKNAYLLDITTQALNTSIGGSFVVSRQFCNKTYDYMGKDDKSHSYETDKNEFSLSSLLNLFTSCNLFLEDRQICYYTNKLQQLTVLVLKPSAIAKEYFIKDTDAKFDSYRTAYNDITEEEIRIEGKTVKNSRLLIGDFSRYTGEGKAEEFALMAKKDLAEIRKNLDNADLLELLKPKAIKVDNKKTANA